MLKKKVIVNHSPGNMTFHAIIINEKQNMYVSLYNDIIPCYNNINTELLTRMLVEHILVRSIIS